MNSSFYFFIFILYFLCLEYEQCSKSKCILGDICEECSFFKNCASCTNIECLKCIPGYTSILDLESTTYKIKKCSLIHNNNMIDYTVRDIEDSTRTINKVN